MPSNQDRPLTPEEQQVCDEYDRRYAEHLERCPLTFRWRVDMAMAQAGGFIAAAFSGPWWLYAGWFVGGFAGAWVLVTVGKFLLCD